MQKMRDDKALTKVKPKSEEEIRARIKVIENELRQNSKLAGPGNNMIFRAAAIMFATSLEHDRKVLRWVLGEAEWDWKRGDE
jgi:hypothetical protein